MTARRRHPRESRDLRTGSAPSPPEVPAFAGMTKQL
jgi:hypothetical protein